MPLERKRKASDNESAVSKLRKARSASSKPSTRDVSPELQTQHEVKATRQSEKARKSTRQTERHPARHNVPETNHHSSLTGNADDKFDKLPENDNSFAALIQPNGLDDGQRTYERLPDGRLRVELSKGSDCVLAGRCTLWVKHGAVSVMGAVLRASPDFHYISAPLRTALPSVEALDGEAEFELSEMRQTAHYSEDAALRPFKPQVLPHGISSETGYFVLGLDFAPVPGIDRPPRILKFNDGHLESFPELKTGRLSDQCILYSGRRPLEAATLAKCIMNRFITTQKHSEGLLFMDLSATAPLFSPPGFVSLGILDKPILGPIFDRSSHNGMKLIRQHFVGHMPIDLPVNSWYRNCVDDLLSIASSLRDSQTNIPLFVNLGNVDALDTAFLEELRSALQPTSVACLLSSRSTEDQDKILGVPNRIPVRQLTSSNEHAHLSRSHDLNLESYFNAVQDGVGNTILQRFGSTLDLQELSFRYCGPGAEILAITTTDTYVPRSDVQKAITGLLAAILLVDLSILDPQSTQLQRCATSRIPVLPALHGLELDATRFDCLGLCYVVSVEASKGSLTVGTPVPKGRLEEAINQGKGLVLVIQPPTRDGAFMSLQQ